MSDPYIKEGCDHEFAPFNFPEWDDMTPEQQEFYSDLNPENEPTPINPNARAEIEKAIQRIEDRFGPSAVLTLTV